MSADDDFSGIEPDFPFTPQPLRFYDGGVDAVEGKEEEEACFGSPALIELVRCTEEGRERFRMVRRIAYRDRHLGELLVPRETRTWRTDLTSVPTLFTWLVPKTGEHLPATLLHDGLIHPPGNKEYTSPKNHTVSRVEADRVLRDAMADAGTKLIRRWLIWSAVTMATMLDRERSAKWKTRYRPPVVLTLGVVAALGVWAFFDLIDLTDVAIRIPLIDVAIRIPNLLWMGDRPWYYELVGGLSGAVVIPLVLATFWGRFWIAGAVVGVSMGVLLYGTVVLLFITGIFQLVEWVMTWMPKRVALALTGIATLVALLVFLFLLAASTVCGW
ncbi:DUF1353 domain-containing protein [Streptomyces sp. IB201691-2A2]|uniref:DUF1353 domain-containing protein n=1 Tax=Streptomyces sp. IB201691-2A2 TaxID=2561920 RepID=UPI00117E018C|nr:DUF1353 domain-containing protein [Streptomyces sp. IB201691-2A2]TRO55813.1 DUF1353 domain-containing protein [Streptomyces sp. IB201691-2A2]